jgi:hypothetical protein
MHLVDHYVIDSYNFMFDIDYNSFSSYKYIPFYFLNIKYKFQRKKDYIAFTICNIFHFSLLL